MDMDQPNSQKRPRDTELFAVLGLLAVLIGYVVYQNIGSATVSTESAQNSSLASSIAANAASNSASQQLAANAGTSADRAGQASPTADKTAVLSEPAAGTAQNGQSRSASLSTNSIAYVRRPRANIRSEASASGSLIGRAYRGTRLTVLSRSGKWVQVENGETKGWVSANLIGSRSR
jgi:uncharacterized protein YgiM (DUF1202 family)